MPNPTAEDPRPAPGSRLRAWMLRRTGGPAVLELTHVAARRPRAHEVAVRVEAIGINYAEVLSRKGLYGWAPRRPYVPGMEAVGRIEEIGADVRDHHIGERVLCGMQHGAYAERVVVDARRAIPALEGYSLEENAAFGVNFLTAWVALTEMARLRTTDRVGITAAAGGVGTAAVQIAAAHGCHVVAMAGTDDKLERVRPLGAAVTVAYRPHGFRERLAVATADHGLDVVVEAVGGDVYRACRERLATFGRVVVVGYAGLDYSLWNPFSWWRAWRGIPRLEVTDAAVRSIGMLATHVGYLLADEHRLRRIWDELVDFVRAHDLRPVVGRTYPFTELPEAHRFMESRESVGKLVVLVTGAADGA